MPRPFNYRRIGQMPACTYYKPQGIPLSTLEQVNLTVDELEAIRLADLEGLQQSQSAEKMNISRQTFGRILESAHKKIAEALVKGKALSIQGGPVEFVQNVQQPFGGQGHRHRRGGRGFGRGFNR